MPDKTYKKIELVGVAEESTDQAVRNAVARAAETLRGLDWFEMRELRGTIANGQVGVFQATLDVGFRVMSPRDLSA